MSDPNLHPVSLLSALKAILSKEEEKNIQQWPGDALNDNERESLRRLGDRFPPVIQPDHLANVLIDSSNIICKRKATDETPSVEDGQQQEEEQEQEQEEEVEEQDEEQEEEVEEQDEEQEEQEEEEEEEQEEEQEGQDEEEEEEYNISSHGLRKPRFQSSANQSSKARMFKGPTTANTPKRKARRTKTCNTPTSLGRNRCPSTTPPAGTKSPPTVPVSPMSGDARPNNDNTWAPIRTLEALELNKVISDSLKGEWEGEADFFLNDIGNLLMSPEEREVRSTQEGFAAILLYYQSIKHRGILDNIRTLFVWLFFGDFAAAAYGENCHITQPRAREIVKALDTRLESRCKLSEMDTKEREKSQEDQILDIRRDIPDLHKKGKRLAHLCQRFGTGCLFWLAQYLTENFVQNRMTLQGRPYAEAMRKLEALGLKQKAEDSGANRLGDRTRKKLAAEFGLAKEDKGGKGDKGRQKNKKGLEDQGEQEDKGQQKGEAVNGTVVE